MKNTYKFDVNLIEEYDDTIKIVAENEEEAIIELKKLLEEEDLSQRKNTYSGSQLTVKLGEKEIDMY